MRLHVSSMKVALISWINVEIVNSLVFRSCPFEESPTTFQKDALRLVNYIFLSVFTLGFQYDTVVCPH